MSLGRGRPHRRREESRSAPDQRRPVGSRVQLRGGDVRLRAGSASAVSARRLRDSLHVLRRPGVRADAPQGYDEARRPQPWPSNAGLRRRVEHGGCGEGSPAVSALRQAGRRRLKRRCVRRIARDGCIVARGHVSCSSKGIGNPSWSRPFSPGANSPLALPVLDRARVIGVSRSP